MRFYTSFAMSAVLAVAAAAPGRADEASFKSTRAPVPAFECQAHVGYDRDLTLPGYLLPTSAGPKTCIPFTSARSQPPAGYVGDYYVDEFTDEKLRARWEACKKDKECHDRVFDQLMARHPPAKEYTLTDVHGRYMLGKVDEKGGETDLSLIRRPGFFAREPYREPIAAEDAQTSIVEFTVPAEAYERLHMKDAPAEIRIRGWYIQGAGVDDGHGGKKRALIILSGGGGDHVVGIDDPSSVSYAIDPKTGNTIPDNNWPNAVTGSQGMRTWREMYHALHEAGIDLLALDRRGTGLSGGYSDTNTVQQGRDLLTVVESLRTGKGMRAYSPSAGTKTGIEAAKLARAGNPTDALPVFFMGSSRGTMSGGWAMTQNFDKDCSYDLPKITCAPARHDPAVKGAIMLADYSSGVGYLPAETSPFDDSRGPGKDRGLFIGGTEIEHNLVFFPSSAILAGLPHWPSAFFARGLWCYADSLEGAMDSYSRVNGPKDLVVVRAPHPYETWPAEEKARVQERIVAYVTAVVTGQSSVPGRRLWSTMKELVATAGDVWEPSTHPTTQP